MTVVLAQHAAHMPDPITTFQAIVLGLLQGVSELFPISSLGHTVLFPTLFGWGNLVHSQSQPESFWLAFVVMLHVGSAVGLLIYFWRDWIDIIRAFLRTLVTRRIETSTERLAWLIIAASIPTGILGIALEHPVRVALAKPTFAAVFLVVNGFILIAAERLRSRPQVAALAEEGGGDRAGRPMESLSYVEATGIGVIQSSALIAGISRDGVAMTGGLLRGLDNEHAAKFAFLLATPIILAAGLFKFGDLTGPDGDFGVRRAALIAAIAAAVAAVVTVHFLLRYFRRNNLIPFGIYCLLFGTAMILYTSV
ncbi:MAG: undecaprenyl-diphosphate phosphatase [Solirubrobacteraceae bacterium]